MKLLATTIAVALLVSNVASAAGQAKPVAPSPTPQGPAPSVPGGTPGVVPGLITPPADYVIGEGDVLNVVYWRDKDGMTGDYAVRPDGKITLPLLNDIDVRGLTPDQLRQKLTKASGAILEDPTITVGVRAINSRKVFIVGGIAKPGPYDLLTPLNVMSLITMAGGLKEWTSGKNILIVREEGGGKTNTFYFNFQDFQKGKDLRKNIPLKPGDQIVVPE
jgi:polysaccharide export outer membrane protein